MICVVFWCNSDRGYFNDPHHCIKLYLYTLNDSTYFFGRKGRLHAWLLEWMQNDSKLPSNYQKGKGTFYYSCCCCCWYYYYNYYFCAPVTNHSNYIGFCSFLTRSINQTINQWLHDTSNVIVDYWLRCGLRWDANSFRFIHSIMICSSLSLWSSSWFFLSTYLQNSVSIRNLTISSPIFLLRNCDVVGNFNFMLCQDSLRPWSF